MSNRMVRVNALLHREISQIIHTEFQADTVAITITSVDIVPDLRSGRVFYSVIGDEEAVASAKRFFKRFAGRIKFLMGKQVVLKYVPHLTYHYDPSLEKGSDLVNRMDEIEAEDKTSDDEH
jgi:ribosome-binding factor A